MSRYRPKLQPLEPCPVEHVVRLVGAKWKARILYRLTLSNAALADLQRHLPRARPQVLTTQLQAMVADGLVRRRDPALDQAWGHYEITERGRGLCKALDALAEWGAAEINGWSAPTLDG